MKKIFSFFLAVCFAGTMMADGGFVEKEGIKYYVDYDKLTAAVSDLTTEFSGTALNIPSAITVGTKEYMVNAISNQLTNKSLTEVTIPKTITNVYTSAFASNASIKTVYWNAIKLDAKSQPFAKSASTLKNVYIGSDVEEICDEMFLSNSAIAILFIGDENGSALTRVGESAFYGTAIKNLNFYNCQNAVEIDESAFSNCTALRTADLSKCGDIGQRAFSGCTSLDNLSLPDEDFYAVNPTIGKWAFDGCEALKIVAFKAATTVSDGAFQGIAKGDKASVYLYKYATLTANDVFSGVTIDEVQIGCNMVENYNNDTYWPAVKAAPTVFIPDSKELTDDKVQIYPEEAKNATCGVQINKPTTCNGKWEFIANPAEGWQFVNWVQPGSVYCNPSLEYSIEDVEDPYFAVPGARFARDEDFDVEMTVKTNLPAEVGGGVKTYAYSCMEDDIERANNRFFIGEIGEFTALDNTKDWATFSLFNYDDGDGTYYVQNMDNTLRVEFRMDDMDPTKEKFPRELTAKYDYVDVDVTVHPSVLGDGKIEGSVSNPVKLGSNVTTLEAVPDAGKYFQYWMLGGTYISSKKIISKDAKLNVQVIPTHLYALTFEDSQESIWNDGSIMELSMAQSLGELEAEYVAVFSDTPLGVDDIQAGQKVQKVIENGQVVILREGKRYNLLGAEMK